MKKTETDWGHTPRRTLMIILKLRSFLSENKWMLIGIAWIITYVLGAIGIYKQFRYTGEDRSFWDPFYRSFQLFLFDDSMVVAGVVRSWELEIARFLAPAVVAYAAFTALIALFHDQILSFRLRMLRRHVVVCGIGQKGLDLIRDLRNHGIQVAAIESDEKNDNIQICRDLKALVIVGDATDNDILHRARVQMADKVVAITGNDGKNVEIAVRTFQLVKNRDKKTHHTVTCFIQIADRKLRVLFGRHPLFTEFTNPVEIKVFNTYSNSARLLFERFPLDRNGILKEDGTEVQLVVVGFGQMGESVLLQAAKTSHFANRKKIRGIIVDRMADKKAKIFYSHYPQFDRVCSTEFVCIEAENPELLDKISKLSENENTWTTIIIALDDDAHALSCALGFLSALDDPDIPIIVRMSEGTGLAVLLQSEAANATWMASIHPFGMTGEICTMRILSDEVLDNFAKKIHEDFITRRLKEGRSLQDPGMFPWEKLNPDMKESNRQQADHIAIKLRAVSCYISSDEQIDTGFEGFSDEEIDLLACMEHDRWVAERLLAGWIIGSKEPGKRQSPYLVDWADLPDPIREYNREIVRNIPAILALEGKRVVRRTEAM